MVDLARNRRALIAVGQAAAAHAAGPTVRAPHVGPGPGTHYQAGLPHDGYPSAFLMETKTSAGHWTAHTGERPLVSR
ncbi:MULTISPECIES: hypothetical protein [unclassified Streptomyces]|uniref:hypothetical protein n=1 Tax=unclassified Streptomyces TaxID=2593676 RepID=UPI003701EAB4